MTPKILGIIVNWNKRDMLDAMLSSLEKSGVPGNFEAVVVDNASTDGSIEMIREKHPWVETLQLPENVGGTGGFNAGMTYGLDHPNNYDFFWLLDNDILVHPGAGQALLKVLLEDPKVGMAGSAILLMDDPEHVQECGTRINWSRGSVERVLEGALRNLPRDRVVEADYVAACSLMARVEAVRQVGIWDPAYFVFWDDMEWGIRFNRAGWKVAATTGSLVQHESYINRRAQAPAFGVYQETRNLLYFLWRHAPAGHRAQVFFRQFRLALSLCDHWKLSGQGPRAQAMGYAIEDFFSGRMGKPRPEVQGPQPSAVEENSEAVQLAMIARVRSPRRLALLVRDNAAMARDLYRRLSEEYPEAKIDTILLDPKPEMLREDLPSRRVANINTFMGRLRLTLLLPMQYNIAVALAFQQPFFFEKLVALNLRYKDGVRVSAAPRDIRALIYLSLLRLRSLTMAAVLTARALLKPRTPVDYFRFRR